ncbi:MAG: DUF2203 domain-containing protein, partial [Candidatus Heimdallarchaeota archaeon]|nr:DUF2203 domain-containing protein [Candidatus Heimdallarchaeota archaeon]
VSKGNHEVAKISQVKYETDLLEEELEELRQKLVMLDCVVKDWRTGLVDFVYESGETIVWLCFQHGEDELQFYHYWDAGFRGRRKIDFE